MNDAAPKKSPRIDEALLAQTLADFTALMQAALAGTVRSRFATVARLANLAETLQSMGGTRVEDFDDDMEEFGGINIGMAQQGILGAGLGRPRRAIAGGDQMEMMRVLIDSITAALSKTNEPKRLPAIDELNGLLTARNSLKLVNENEDTEDLDRRIAALRKELTDVVVPADVLRGHPLEALGGHGDGGHLGEADGDRARGDGGAVQEGAGQEVDAGDRAAR